LTLQEIFDKISEKLTPLMKDKKTGKVVFGLEFHFSQGSIGDCFIETNTRERVREEK